MSSLKKNSPTFHQLTFLYFSFFADYFKDCVYRCPQKTSTSRWCLRQFTNAPDYNGHIIIYMDIWPIIIIIITILPGTCWAITQHDKFYCNLIFFSSHDCNFPAVHSKEMNKGNVWWKCHPVTSLSLLSFTIESLVDQTDIQTFVG